MPNIYILEQGTTIKRKNNQIAIYKNERNIISFPINSIDNLYLFGKIEIKNSAISFLLRNNKYIIFLTNYGFFKGFISNTGLTSNNKNRYLQYKILFENTKHLEFCKNLINIKLEEIEKCFHINLYKEKEKLYASRSLNEILGIEGLASAKMFSKFRELLKDININFSERSYNPPKDEVNAILSLMYMLYFNLLVPLTLKEGFDPYLGLLHKKRGTHMAFVSDILETSRPRITYYTYEFLTNNPIKDMNFLKKEKGVYIDNTYLKYILSQFIDFIDNNNLPNNNIKSIINLIRKT